MEKQEIIDEATKLVDKLVEDLSDQDYMDVLYEISGNLKGSADCKAEELGID